MIRRRTHLKGLGTIGLIISVIVVLATTAASRELLPDTAEMVVPVGDTDVSRGEEAPASLEVRSIPLLPAVDAETYRAMKTQARQTPTAQQRQVLEALAAPKPLASVATSFVGLDGPGAGINGAAFFPPDTIVAKSSTRVLEGVNSALRLFTTTGGILATQDLNSFFGASTAQGPLFDPKVYFDRNATNRRFYIVALQQTGTSDASGFSRIWLAVSRSSEPGDLTSSWCRYAIDGKRNAGTSLSSWADYPGLGVGADKLVISANQLTFAPSGQESFTFAIIRVLNKLTAANNASGDCPTIPLFTFQPSNTSGDSGAFTLQPAQHCSGPSSFSGTSNPAYLVNTIYGSSASYRVWRVRNIDPPTLQGPTSVLGNFMYGFPPDADQPDSSTLLDTGDVRVTQVAGLGNAISGVHGTVCNFTGSTPNEACVRPVGLHKLLVDWGAGYYDFRQLPMGDADAS